jgi:hypothetical protein
VGRRAPEIQRTQTTIDHGLPVLLAIRALLLEQMARDPYAFHAAGQRTHSITENHGKGKQRLKSKGTKHFKANDSQRLQRTFLPGRLYEKTTKK